MIIKSLDSIGLTLCILLLALDVVFLLPEK